MTGSLIVHRLAVPLVFPAGVHPGAGKDAGNRLIVARDGMGRPVLRGSSVAGALRHAYAASLGVSSRSEQVSKWFGSPCDELGDSASGEPSRVRVADSVLGGPHQLLTERHHISIDRHFGVAREGGRFDVQASPPGSRATIVIEVHAPAPDAAEGMTIVRALAGLFKAGMLLGGCKARGIGMAHVQGAVLLRTFDLAKVEDHAAFLDERYSIRQGNPPKEGEPIDDDAPAGGPRLLQIALQLRVPRGQDFLVGDGQGFDYEIEPQRVRAADGSELWRLPGSSLRGIFRAWVSRLARREGLPVADSLERYREQGPPKGDELAWGFDPPETRSEKQSLLRQDPAKLSEAVPCPVMRLFGSAYACGRIHFADAYAPRDPAAEQPRMHVAVDRITGGANEGMLFDNSVLTSPVQFEISIRVQDPTESEARWLAATIAAIDRGIVRVGSSKASGRLALSKSPEASGPFAEFFRRLEPCEDRNDD